MIKQYNRLTDLQWDAISVFLDTKRKRKLNLRDVMDAILYILRTGCQWRNIPNDYPNWQAVFWYFSKWKKANIFAEINISLNKLDRKNNGRDENPAIFSIDSQSIKLSPMIWEDRGIDAHKKVNGRKRQLLPGRRAVDSGGRLWFAKIHAANLHDGAAALGFMPDIICQNERLVKIYGDQAYAGVFADEIENTRSNLKRLPSLNPPKDLYQLQNDGWSKEQLPGQIFLEELSKIMNIPSHPVRDGCI